MERVPVIRDWWRPVRPARWRVAIALFAVALLGATPSPEKSKAPTKVSTKASTKASTKVDEAEAPSKTPRRDINKVRPGSLLRKEGPTDEAPDLRGDAERRRDLELVRHFERIAELDVIEQLAARQDDLALLERVEAVRRKELRRHWARLQQLRAWALLKNWQGNP